MDEYAEQRKAIETITEWIREPDYADRFSKNHLIAWAERRPRNEAENLRASFEALVSENERYRALLAAEQKENERLRSIPRFWYST